MPSHKKKGGKKGKAQNKARIATEPAELSVDSQDKKTLNADQSSTTTTAHDSANKGSSVSSKKGLAIDLKTLRNVFRFLDLPPEIRNKIYRLLLLSTEVAKRVPNPAYYNNLVESEPTGYQDFNLDDVPVGTVRCQNIWIQTVEHHTAVLRVNHQIHEEASSIFKSENAWVTVHVNKSGFGAAIKSLGFGVVHCGDISKFPRSVLNIGVTFPSLIELGEADTFVMAALCLSQLPRALWTVKGIEEMSLYIDIDARFANNPSNESALLQCFRQIRGVKNAVVQGASSKEFNTELPRLMMKPYADDEDISLDMQHALEHGCQALQHQNYDEAEGVMEASLAFLADCFRVHSSYPLLTRDDTVKLHTVTVQLALNLAIVKNHMGKYQHAIKYINYAMTIQPISQADKCTALLQRGRAYAGLKQDNKAVRDFLAAQQVFPTDPDVIRELGDLKKRLHRDPARALLEFKKLRLTVKKEEEEEEAKVAAAMHESCLFDMAAVDVLLRMRAAT